MQITANAVAALVAAALLASCTLQLPAPVDDRSTTEGARWKTYTVRKNDTLYTIAWRHNLDYEALAEANGIEPPYIIRPGQRLVLVARQVRGARPAPQRGSNTAAATTTPRQVKAPAWEPTTVAEVSSDAPAAQSPPPQPAPAATAPAPDTAQPASNVVAQADPATPVPTPTNAVADPQSQAPTSIAATPPAPVPTAQPPSVASTPSNATPGWRQPVAAAPVRTFGGTSRGFDYDLAPAARVFAAHDGEVAYSGPGLGGFRHTVIVKAGDQYLVAYSLNAPPKLNEGDNIAAGDLVAEIGSGADAGRLHFEIRERGSGQAVDPGPLIGR